MKNGKLSKHRQEKLEELGIHLQVTVDENTAMEDA
jgi:hypothetical protein